MKRQRELAALFLKKALRDLVLLDAILNDTDIHDEIFGFHAQQAAEKFLKSVLAQRPLLAQKLTISANYEIYSPMQPSPSPPR